MSVILTEADKIETSQLQLLCVCVLLLLIVKLLNG